MQREVKKEEVQELLGFDITDTQYGNRAFSVCRSAHADDFIVYRTCQRESLRKHQNNQLI